MDEKTQARKEVEEMATEILQTANFYSEAMKGLKQIGLTEIELNFNEAYPTKSTGSAMCDGVLIMF